MEARRQRISGVLQRITILAVLLLTAFGPALAGPRSFRMALWNGNDLKTVDYGWLYPGSAQPANHPVILNISGVYDRPDLYEYLAGLSYQWPLIAAVIIDEPYLGALNGLSANSCDWNENAQAEVARIASLLSDAADAVHLLGTTTRFWVNFSEPEVQWMMNCGLSLNQGYINVVSLDKYDTPFAGVKPYYDWLELHRATAQQQFALVPGTFYLESPSSRTAAVAASWLQSFFDYANSKNANRQGLPLVWLIMGFADDVLVDGGITYRGLHAQGSEQIANVWRKQRSWGWVPEALFPPPHD